MDLGVIQFYFLARENIYLYTLPFPIHENQRMFELRIMEIGEDVYFIGFPYTIGTKSGIIGNGLFADIRINPALRHGIISWKHSDLNRFLIDGFSFGGNSGSPIFTKTQRDGSRYLAGIITGHLSDSNIPTADINFGLAICTSYNVIEKLIKQLK